MVAQPNRLLMSVQAYLTLDRGSIESRYEFIDGLAYMLAGGTGNHALIGGNMIGELRNALRGSPCRVYTSDMKVRLSESRYVYPDITVSCDARERGTDDILLYPHLVIEVLSPGTEAYDRGKKFGYYRACPTIEEYVLVDTQQPFVEVYRRENGFWRLYPFGPDDQVMLTSLDISFPVATLYENVTLSENTSDSSST